MKWEKYTPQTKIENGYFVKNENGTKLCVGKQYLIIAVKGNGNYSFCLKRFNGDKNGFGSDGYGEVFLPFEITEDYTPSGRERHRGKRRVFEFDSSVAYYTELSMPKELRNKNMALIKILGEMQNNGVTVADIKEALNEQCCFNGQINN